MSEINGICVRHEVGDCIPCLRKDIAHLTSCLDEAEKSILNQINVFGDLQEHGKFLPDEIQTSWGVLIKTLEALDHIRELRGKK